MALRQQIEDAIKFGGFKHAAETEQVARDTLALLTALQGEVERLRKTEVACANEVNSKGPRRNHIAEGRLSAARVAANRLQELLDTYGAGRVPEPRIAIRLANPEDELLREIADKRMKREDVALTYALAIRGGKEIDWPKVNKAIIERWSRSALRWIKERAWKQNRGGGGS